MSRPRRRQQTRTAAPAEVRPRWLVWAAMPLLIAGLAVSLYLGHLYLSVRNPGLEGQVESFCALSESFNCVTVATSEYATFLGLPIALYGLEFFATLWLVVLASRLGLWRVRSWDSLVFLGAACGLPACGVLAWISARLIHSFCIMCLAVYVITGLLFLLPLLFSARRLPELIRQGPREVLGLLRTGRGAAGALLLAALFGSQLVWVPRLTNADAVVSTTHEGQLTSGLTLGPRSAPVTIEEFTDFQCPYCGEAHKVLMQLVQRYKDKIRVIHRDYPLDNACNPTIDRPFHPQACQAAVHARCAARQNKYWPFEALLFANRALLSDEGMAGFARQAGVDLGKLRACVADPRTLAAVKQDIQEGIQRGLKGTPTFFVNGEAVVGLRPLGWWEEKIDALLKQRPGR